MENEEKREREREREYGETHCEKILV